MLDQNTDRMWFVIGAVIVGAAIIFIANGSLPTLFASVTDTFSESAAIGTSVIDDISELDYGPNLVEDGVYEKQLDNHSNPAPDAPGRGHQYETVYFYDLSQQLKPNTEYRVSFDYKTTPNVGSINVYLLGYSPELTRLDLNANEGSYETVEWTLTTGDNIQHPTNSLYNSSQLRFDNNYSTTSETATLWMRNVQIREYIGGSD